MWANHRKVVIALEAGALGPFASFLRHSPKIQTFGFLSTWRAFDLSSAVEAFRAGLRNRGYVEVKYIA